MFTRPTLIRESVYDHLRDAILNGEFQPAERLWNPLDAAGLVGIHVVPAEPAGIGVIAHAWMVRLVELDPHGNFPHLLDRCRRKHPRDLVELHPE